MTPRYVYYNYDLLHKYAEVMFRMQMVKLRCIIRPMKEGPKRNSA